MDDNNLAQSFITILRFLPFVLTLFGAIVIYYDTDTGDLSNFLIYCLVDLLSIYYLYKHVFRTILFVVFLSVDYAFCSLHNLSLLWSGST